MTHNEALRSAYQGALLAQAPYQADAKIGSVAPAGESAGMFQFKRLCLFTIAVLAMVTPALGWENERGLSFQLPDGWVVYDQFPIVMVANSEESLGHNQLEGDDLLVTLSVEESSEEPKLLAEAAAEREPENSRVYPLGKGWVMEGHNEDYAGVKIFYPVGEAQVHLFAHSFREYWPRYRDAVLDLSQTLSYQKVPPPPLPRFQSGEVSFEYYEDWHVFEESDAIYLSNSEVMPTPGKLKSGEWLVQVRVEDGHSRTEDPYQGCISAFREEHEGAQLLDGGSYHTGAYVYGSYGGDLVQYFQLHPVEGKRLVVQSFKPTAAEMQGVSFGGIQESLTFRGARVFPEDDPR